MVYLKNTYDSVLKIIWPTNEDGIAKVRADKYAYILPNVIVDYISQREPCDLETLDTFLMHHGYGLALAKKSKLLSDFNEALITLDEDGFLQRLYQKWWIQRSDCDGIKSSKMYSVYTGDRITIVVRIDCIAY